MMSHSLIIKIVYVVPPFGKIPLRRWSIWPLFTIVPCCFFCYLLPMYSSYQRFHSLLSLHCAAMCTKHQIVDVVNTQIVVPSIVRVVAITVAFLLWLSLTMCVKSYCQCCTTNLRVLTLTVGVSALAASTALFVPVSALQVSSLQDQLLAPGIWHIDKP